MQASGFQLRFLLLKARARAEKGQIAVIFIDDNFAINIKRTKSLLRDIIAAKAQVHWWRKSPLICCATKNWWT